MKKKNNIVLRYLCFEKVKREKGEEKNMQKIK